MIRERGENKSVSKHYEEQELKADRHHEKKAGRFDKGLRNANSQLIKKIQIQTPDILEDKLTER